MFLRVVAAAGEVQDHRIAALEFRQPPAFAGVIGELIIGERRPRLDVSSHGASLFLRASDSTRLPRVGAATLVVYPRLRYFSQVQMCLLPIISQSGLSEASAAAGTGRKERVHAVGTMLQDVVHFSRPP